MVENFADEMFFHSRSKCLLYQLNNWITGLKFTNSKATFRVKLPCFAFMPAVVLFWFGFFFLIAVAGEIVTSHVVHGKIKFLYPLCIFKAYIMSCCVKLVGLCL